MKFIELFGLSELDEMSGKGISVLISTVLTFLFAVVMITIALNVVNPTFKRAQDMTTVGDAFQNLEIINSAIEEVSSESEGSKRTISVSVTDGTYRTDNTFDWIYFQFEPKQRISMSGSRGDVEVQRDQEFFDAFNWYVDSTGADGQWMNDTGQWLVSSYKYQGINGTSYHNFSKTMNNWGFSGDISNVTGPTGGQIFVLPVNPETLVGFWPFDNSSGNKGYDYSGNGNNGIMTNMYLSGGNESSGWQNSSACKAGVNCLSFDGVDNYVNATDSASLDITNGVTIVAWVKLARLAHSGGHTVATKRVVGGTDTNYQLWITAYGDGNGDNVLASYAGGAIGNVFGTVSLDLDWHQVALVHTTTDALFYVDGVLDRSQSQNLGAVNNGPLMIGHHAKDHTFTFNGTIDEVMIFNASLSATQIASLYETSVKKLVVSGSKNIDAETPNGAIVLANPEGTTKFDNILVTGSQKELKMIISYINVDINGTMRLPKGDHKIEIRHMGTNSTSNRPTIQLTNA